MVAEVAKGLGRPRLTGRNISGIILPKEKTTSVLSALTGTERLPIA